MGTGFFKNQIKEETKMCKKFWMLVFFGVMLICSVPLVANAVSINFLYDTNGNEFISPYSGVTTEDFEGALLWTWLDNYAVVQGDISGVASAPFGVSTKDTSKYVTVPQTTSTSPLSATADLGGTYNYLGLWWGSVDTYNTLTFIKNGVDLISFTGSDITTPNAANGNQTAPSTNLYVNFLGLPDFDAFRMTSTQYAFEADNISVANVPEPATMLLLGLGLLGFAGARRKFKN